MWWIRSSILIDQPVVSSTTCLANFEEAEKANVRHFLCRELIYSLLFLAGVDTIIFIRNLMKTYWMTFHTCWCMAFFQAFFPFSLNRIWEAISYRPISAFSFMDLSLRLHDSFAEIEPMHLRWSHTGWSVCCFHFPNIRDYVKLFCVVLRVPSAQMPVASLSYLILQQLFGILSYCHFHLYCKNNPHYWRFFLLILLAKWLGWRAGALSFFSSLYSLYLVKTWCFVQKEAQNKCLTYFNEFLILDMKGWGIVFLPSFFSISQNSWWGAKRIQDSLRFKRLILSMYVWRSPG